MSSTPPPLASTLPTRLLQEVVQAARLLVGRDGAGVMFADADEALCSVVSTDPAGAVLEGLQTEFGEGPGVDAYVHDTMIFSDDLDADARYPNLGRLCSAHQVVAAAGRPLRLGGQPVGAIDVYGRTSRPWTDDELAALDAYGTVVENLLAARLAAYRNDQLAGQLQYALDYRVVIERGVGYLMARDGLDSATAFDHLRSAARSTRRKVTEVSRDLLEGGLLPAD